MNGELQTVRSEGTAVPGSAQRFDVNFEVGGELCHAWLYLPDGATNDRRVPIVVMAHGLGGTKAIRLAAYAERFWEAGYACLVFDYRHLGESAGRPRGLVDVNDQIEDWKSAVSYARTLAQVDPDRVVLWGTSFAGGHVMVVAAADARIAGVISQCPFTDGPATGRIIPPRTKFGLTVRALGDLIGSWFGLAPVRVPLVGRPGEMAILTTPDAATGFEDLLKASSVNAIPDLPARIVLQLLSYRPGESAKDVRCPSLFCICEGDSVAPSSTTIEHVRKASRAHLKRYPEGHFEIYVGPAMNRIVGDQIAFLREHVPV